MGGFDIVAENLPPQVLYSPDAWCACIAGAVSEAEYLSAVQAAGFEDVRAPLCTRPAQLRPPAATAARQATMIYHFPGKYSTPRTATAVAVAQTTTAVRPARRGISRARNMAGMAKSSPQANGSGIRSPRKAPAAVEVTQALA